mgnify:CR=1 FL=1
MNCILPICRVCRPMPKAARYRRNVLLPCVFLRGEERGIVFVTAEALLQKLPDKTVAQEGIEINCGSITDQQELIAKFTEFGYERTQQVDAIGQFCVRGDILDIFPINSKLPLRIEWFDDTVDVIRSFSLENQRSVEKSREN